MKPKGSTIKRYTCKKDHEHGNKCPATWWARVIYIDPETGKSHDLSRRATSYANAIDKRDQLVAEIEAIPFLNNSTMNRPIRNQNHLKRYLRIRESKR
jgi:deferrochelatase/peroxidase EfeB